MEAQDGMLRQEDALARIVDRFMSKDPSRLMRERRNPATGMLIPPVSRDEARTYYETCATIVVEIKDICKNI